MPKYRITDPQTGRQVVVSGNKPPSQKDAEAIFQQAGLRETQQEPTRPTQKPQDKGNFITNAPRSFVDNLLGIAEAGKMFFSPVTDEAGRPTGPFTPLNNQLTRSIANVGVGAIEKVIPGKQKEEVYADAVGNYYKDRYGGASNIADTFNQDPIGVLLDLSTVLSGAGAAAGIAGKAGTAGKLSKVSRVVNPVEQAANLGTKAVTKTLGKLEAPFRGAVKTDVTQAAKELGIADLPLSARTSSNVIKQGEALAEKGLFGQKITNTINRVKKELDQKALDITASVSREPEFLETGKKITKGFEDYVETYNKTKGEMYDALPTDLYKNPGVFDSTLQALDEIIERKGQSLAGDTNVAYYKSLKGKIEELLPSQAPTYDPFSRSNVLKKQVDSLTKEIQLIEETGTNVSGRLYKNSLPGLREQVKKLTQQIEEALAKEASTPLPTSQGKATIAQLKQTRTDIGSKLKNHADPVATGDRASLGKLYAALSDDLDDSITRVDAAAGQALQEANKFYREGLEKINSKLGKRIQTTDPEKLVDQLVKPNSETSLEAVKEIIGEEAFNSLRESFLAKIYQKSLKDDVIDIKRLETQLKAYGEPTLKKLLDKDQFARLQALRSDLQKIETVRKGIRNPASSGSQTAFLLTQGIGLGATLFTNPALFVQLVLGQYGGTKLLTSGFGQRYLTTGFNASDPLLQLLKSIPVGQAAKTGQATEAVMPKNPYMEKMEAMRRMLSR